MLSTFFFFFSRFDAFQVEVGTFERTRKHILEIELEELVKNSLWSRCCIFHKREKILHPEMPSLSPSLFNNNGSTIVEINLFFWQRLKQFFKQ